MQNLNTKYLVGKPEHVARARNRAEFFVGMDGANGQAPGAVVVRRSLSKGPQWVVHWANTEFGGFSYGEYEDDLARAKLLAKRKVLRFDPTGEMRRSFSQREGLASDGHA